MYSNSHSPPRWCGTLGNFRNWRVVEQGDIIPLAKLISTFKGFEGTEAQFRKAAGIAEDGVATGQQIRTRIQLINAVTKEPLVMIPSPNTLGKYAVPSPWGNMLIRDQTQH